MPKSLAKILKPFLDEDYKNDQPIFTEEIMTQIEMKLNHLEQGLTQSINMLLDEEVDCLLKKEFDDPYLSADRVVPNLKVIRSALYKLKENSKDKS